MNGNCENFSSNSSINNDDVYLAKIVVSISSGIKIDSNTAIKASFSVNISFMADILYTSNDILSVFQEQNQADPSWTKFGVNSTYEATPTKIESNSLSNLSYFLEDSKNNTNGNTNYTLSDVYSESAPVYKDIDVVNVDIATGEIIGKLSDPNYQFEWYGREVTLSAGTTLASGRTLETDETFTVDVYTYYPTMYLRRWVVGNVQWISVSDKEFTGAVKIKAYYTATFESTIFNPDKTVAENEYGIIPRSYVYDYSPLTYGSVSYIQSYYNFGDSSVNNADAIPYMRQYAEYTTNLTKAWRSSDFFAEHADCVTTTGVQGENYTSFVYNLLYIIKYANNNSQSQVGKGNSYSFSVYYNRTEKIKSTSGEELSLQDTYNARFESQKGGGTIGVLNYINKGTAEYTNLGTEETGANANWVLSATGYDAGGMNYGYNSGYTYTDSSGMQHKTGLYANQFLTYNNGTRRYLCDGYVGSDGYTSVFCLGKANPWGNVMTAVYGVYCLSDGTSMYAYVIFDDYDYEQSNYLLWNFTNDYEENDKTLTENYGAIKLSYTVLATNAMVGIYNGTTSSIVTQSGIEALVGLPASDGTTSSTQEGLCSYVHASTGTPDNRFKVLFIGGSTQTQTGSGIFDVTISLGLNGMSQGTGYRSQLVT